LENLDNNVDINLALERVRSNIEISGKEGVGHHELKQHKPWIDGELKIVR
jgi:hypothetical protein